MNEEGRPDRIDGPDDSTDGKPDGDGVGADDQHSGSGSDSDSGSDSQHDPQETLAIDPDATIDVAPSTPASRGGDAPPEQIGPYRVLEPLGEGGFGIVYRAEQRGKVRRTVALKIIKKGMDSNEVLARFDAEKNALSLMNHPNIARVIDSGQTDSGQPYFVMEYVDGTPITTYCQKERLTLKERLQLFQQVCRGVQHAHSKAVVHRDLKPANILVTRQDDKSVPKIIDFGLVKALGGALTEMTVVTQQRQILGTLEYMSPEQARSGGSDIDTKTDVYALGVILYELLVDVRPFDMQKTSDWEMLRIVEEDDPPRPSQRYSSLAAASTESIAIARGLNAKRLSQLLSNELDWIVLKALEKKRERRYETPLELAADLERYLVGNEPVKARPPSIGYRMKKFSRRYRAALTATVLVFAALTLGISWAMVERDRAQKNEIRAVAGENEALEQKEIAQQARTEAERQRTEADQQRTEAENQKKQADAQRSIAVEEKNKAEEARNEAEQARIEAEEEREKAKQSEARALASQKEALEQKDLANRRLYLVEMNQAGLNWEEGDVTLVRKRIDAYRTPADPSSDPRGFEWGYWDRLCNRDLRTFTGHTGEVWGVAFSPDGTHLASASLDNTVKLWDAVTGREVATFTGHEDDVTDVKFSPDGLQLVSASSDKTVKLWDVATGEETATLTGHKDVIMSVAFGPDGKRIVSGSYDNTLRLWDVATGKELHIFEGHVKPIWAVSFSPDGALVASASWDETVKLWDVATGKETATLTGHTWRVVSVAFSPDSTQIASGSWDSTVKLWDVATGEETASLTGHKGTVLDVAFSPDGTTVGSVCVDKSVKLWDVATTTEIGTFLGHGNFATAIAFSPDGARIASGSSDSTLKLWGFTSGRQAVTLTGHKDLVWGVAFSPNGRRIATASFDKTVKLWDASSGQETATLTGHTHRVDFVAFSPDSTRLASSSWDQTVKLWDVASGRETASFTGHTGRIHSVAFSPDGTTVASACADKTVKLWDISTGDEKATLTMETTVSFVAFSPDGDRLVTSSPRTVTLWDVATGRQTATLSGHTDLVFCVAFGPNGERVVSGSNDKTVKLWDVATGQEITTFIGHTGFVMGVAFSPDGLRLASASGDKTVKLWDVVTGRETATFTEHTESVRTVAFSPDGLRVASGGFDHTVKLWDARRWTPELKVQDETRGYLTFHTPRFSSDAALQEAIQADQTISDQVRQQALDWSELFRKNYAQQQLDRAHQRAVQLFTDSWGIVKQPELSAEQYQTALEMAAEANSLRPDHGQLLQVLGIAQFRAQKYKEALATLIRFENPDDPATVDAPPYGPVFIAMTRFQLGEQEQAADLLNKIKAKADQVKEKDPQGKRLDLFIKEAESLIRNEVIEP